MRTSSQKRRTPDIALYRDRAECSLDLHEIPVAPATPSTLLHSAIGLTLAAAAICTGGYMVHIMQS